MCWLVSFCYWTLLKHHCSVQECISEQSKQVQHPCNKIDPAKGDCSSCCGFTEENLPEPRIVLLGPTGVGKSTFGNRYFGDSLTLIVQQKRFCSFFQALDTQGIAILKKVPFQKYPDFVGITKIAFEPHPHPPLSQDCHDWWHLSLGVLSVFASRLFPSQNRVKINSKCSAHYDTTSEPTLNKQFYTTIRDRVSQRFFCSANHVHRYGSSLGNSFILKLGPESRMYMALVAGINWLL